MVDLTAALARVVDALDAAEVEYAIVGSTAAAAWGVARTTRDVDLVLVVGPNGPDDLLDGLVGEDLYIPEEGARRALQTDGSFNVLHPSSGGKVDVFVAPASDDFTRSRLERRVRSEVLGIVTWVATPEDVILAKLRWRLESRSEVQWRDCVEIAAVQTLDEAYLQRWAPQLGVVEDLGELLEATRST